MIKICRGQKGPKSKYTRGQMKFLLVMQICSAINLQCMPDVVVGSYHTHFDCATAGYLNAMSTVQRMGPEMINKDRIIIRFSCNPVSST